MTLSPHPATDAVLRRGALGHADTRAVTLDPRFQGLPDTAHGGAVLALFDTLVPGTAPRLLAGTYRRRVPLGTPLQLVIARAARDDAATAGAPTAANRTDAGPELRVHLMDGRTELVSGRVTPSDRSIPVTARDSVPCNATAAAPGGSASDAAAPAGGAMPLPLSKTCFACGIENDLGLRARLTIDDARVSGTWTPREALRGTDDQLAPVALTTLLDEAAFWLGAAASGEAGMTTELRVTLHAPVAFGRAVHVAGAHAAVRQHADDPRYWDTAVAAWDETGAVVATAAITFAAVRGAARKLVAGLLAMNPPEILHRVFPAYAADGRGR